MTELISHPYTQALGWALVHFLWQGAAIGLASYALLRVLRTPRARYAAGVATLAVLLAAPVVTFAILARQHADATTVAGNEGPAGVAGPARELASNPGSTDSAGSTGSTGSFSPISPAILFTVLSVWLIGVALLSVRLAGGWMLARRIAKQHVRPAAADIQALARRVAGRLALERIVSVFESSAVSVPVMIGWIKPAVLLPVAALSGLSTTQIEALLAHELAHVQRHDYLVNLLQSAVETLLFYHPAVWWISRQVRNEREHCCDDLAVAVCDRVVYVTALADLATLSSTPRLALAATDGSLARRVRRILGRGSNDTRESTSPWLPIMLVGLMVVTLIPIVAARAATEPTMVDRPAVQLDIPAVEPAAAPAQSDVLLPADPSTGSDAAGAATFNDQEAAARQITEEQRQRLTQQLERIQAQLEELRQAIREATGGAAAETRKAVELAAVDRARAAEARSRVTEELKRSALERQRAVVDKTQRIEEAMRLTRRATEENAQAQLDNARRDIERVRDLVARGLMSASETLAAERKAVTAAEKLQAESAQAMERLIVDQAARTKRGSARMLSPEASSMRDRIMQMGAGLSDQDVMTLFKEIRKLDGDANRAEVLIALARVRPFTPEMVTQYLSVAETIQMEAERQRVLDQSIRLKSKGRE